MLVNLRGFQRCSRPAIQSRAKSLVVERRQSFKREVQYGFADFASQCSSPLRTPDTQGLPLLSRAPLDGQWRIGKPSTGFQHDEAVIKEGSQIGQHADDSGDALIHDQVEDDTSKTLTSPLSRLAHNLYKADNPDKVSIRTKYVNLASWTELNEVTDTAISEGAAHLDSVYNSWCSRFQRMLSGHGLNLYVVQQASIDAVLEEYADPAISIRSLQDAWLKIPDRLEYSPIRLWQDLMLWCVENAPLRALKLLLATSQGIGFRPPRYMVADSLEQIASKFLANTKEPDSWIVKIIHGLLGWYVAEGDRTLERSTIVPDRVAYLLLGHSNDDEVQDLLKMFIENNASLHYNTLLHFLERSIYWGTLSLSMRLLQSIVNSGINTSRYQVQAACIKLIRARLKGEQQYQIRIKTITQIFEMGIKPQIALYNAILLNAIEAKDFETAWQMHAVAKENGLAPDEITYCILLKGALLIEDSDLYEKLIDEILGARTVLQRSRRLISDLLHSLIRKRYYSGREEFPRLLDIYKEYCNLTPLHDLGICRPDVVTAHERTSEVQWPSSPILMHMICSYVRKHQTSDDLINVYNQYRDLVKKRHPLFSPLPQWDYVPNAFVMAFGLRRETLKYCTTVIKDMLDRQHTAQESKEPGFTDKASQASKPSLPVLELKSSFPRQSSTPETAQILSSSLGRIYDAKPPSVITWSILLHAYFRHEQRFAAEKVLDLMKERGLRRDRVTWNTIIGGYAKMQDVDATVETFQGMRVNGHVANVITLKNLARLWDRRRLVEALKKTAISGSPKQTESDAPMIDLEKNREEEGKRFLCNFKIASASRDSSGTDPDVCTFEPSKESDSGNLEDEVDGAIHSDDFRAVVVDANQSFDMHWPDAAANDEEPSTPDEGEEQVCPPGAVSPNVLEVEYSEKLRALVMSQEPREELRKSHSPTAVTSVRPDT